MKHLPFLILLIACTTNQARAEQQVPSPLPPELRREQQPAAAEEKPVYHPAKAPRRPDYTVLPIACVEPIKPRDFPPLPNRLDLTGTEKTWPKTFSKREELSLPGTTDIDRKKERHLPDLIMRSGDFGPRRNLLVIPEVFQKTNEDARTGTGDFGPTRHSQEKAQ